jgi:putative NIF3 family GTP cyclohydrolase 1 type 2
MEVQDLIRILTELAPGLSMDSLGKVFPPGSGSKLLSKIGVCVDPTEENIQTAVAKEMEVLISYHPWYHEAEDVVTQQGIHIVAVHEAWDSVPEGIAPTFAKTIGLTGLTHCESVLTGQFQGNFRELLERCQRVLDLNVVPYCGETKDSVVKVGLWPGPGFLPTNRKIWEICRAAGCDTILSGEISIAPMRYAAANRFKLIDLGHSAMAKPGMQNLANILQSRLKAKEVTVDFLRGFYGCNYNTTWFFPDNPEQGGLSSLFSSLSVSE